MSLFSHAPVPLYDDHTQNVLSDRLCLFDTSVDNFGLFSFTVADFPETTDEMVFLFTVDQSASMSDVCSDGRTKMHHVTHTLKNMLLFLRECKVVASVHILGFDHDVRPVLDTLTRVTPESVATMITAIDTHLYPKGGTNIGQALRSASRLMTELQTNAKTRMHHIFMTDGEVTNGVSSHDALMEMVVPGFHHSFLGFGINHDFTLLNRLGNATEMCAYHFIDKLENAGMVYGEILHSIVYNVISDARVLVSGPAEVYDCRTNTWTKELYVGDVASGMTKTFHLRTWQSIQDPIREEAEEEEEGAQETKEECALRVHCALKGTYEGMTTLYTVPTSIVVEETGTTLFTMYRYRQRVLELLHEVTRYVGIQRNEGGTNAVYTQMDMEEEEAQSNSTGTSTNTEAQAEAEAQAQAQAHAYALGPFDTKTRLKIEMKLLVTEMKQMLSCTTDPMDQIFLQKLCDDVYVCYRTFGTNHGAMYCNSRLSSQGIQRQYAASVPEPATITSTTTNNGFGIGCDATFGATMGYNESTVYNGSTVYNVTSSTTTDTDDFMYTFTNANPYSTQQATDVMRFVSSEA